MHRVGFKYQFTVSHLHDGRVTSEFLLGATHQNGCLRDDAVMQKSLFANGFLRPGAVRKASAKQKYHWQ
jgi:hypothetical protein